MCLNRKCQVLADEQLTGSALEVVQRRLDLWLAQHVEKLLGPLADLENGEGLDGMARGIAFQIGEHLGVLDRARCRRRGEESLARRPRGVAQIRRPFRRLSFVPAAASKASAARAGRATYGR